MVFHHIELQLKSRTSQQWTLALGFKNEVVEVSQVCNAVIIIFLSRLSSLTDEQCGVIYALLFSSTPGFDDYGEE